MTRAVQIAELGDQNVFSIDSSNNRVGIGSTQPTEILDVEGAIRVGTGITIDSASGIITATKFVGPMEGTVTGNISGTSGGLSGTPDITVRNVTGVAATFTGIVTYEDVTNIDSVGIITARSHVSIADSILHTGDTDTSIRFPAADTFTVETGGSERVRVTSAGRVGIGSAIPGHNLEIMGSFPDFAISDSDTTNDKFRILHNGGGTQLMVDPNNVGPNASYLLVAVDGTEKLRVDSSGRTLINTSSSIATEPDVQGYTPALQVVHAPSSAGTNGVSINRFQAGNAFAPPLIFQKSKNDTIGSHTIVADNDELGDISFAGSDGAAFRTAARINVDVDGTPGSSDMPGRIQFSTTADGAATPTERLRIDSAGRMLIGATSAVAGADANGLLQVSQDVGSNTCIIVAENTASSGNLSCFRARLRNHNPDSIFSAFLQCDDSSASKAVIRSNGGLANFSANNVNLSDRNAKKDITAAAGTWNSIKNWEIVNFRYKEQPDDADLNLGVIAQQIEEISPEMVTIFQQAKEATETEPAREQRLGVKEQQMQWMATKALQEAMARIETLETQNADLEARLTALEGS